MLFSPVDIVGRDDLSYTQIDQPTYELIINVNVKCIIITFASYKFIHTFTTWIRLEVFL